MEALDEGTHIDLFAEITHTCPFDDEEYQTWESFKDHVRYEAQNGCMIQIRADHKALLMDIQLKAERR